MSWIKLIPYKKASKTLNKIYDRVKGLTINVDNSMLVHNFWLHSKPVHKALYKKILHNNKNNLPKWFLKIRAVFVNNLYKFNDSINQSSKGLKRLLKDKAQFKNIQLNLQSQQFCKIVDTKYEKALNYAKLLTLNSSSIKNIRNHQ